ncbi:MAG: hypothetical protein JNM51_13110 [Bacteroidia bacterium]|nr:hypothetical protein [Bacteroidia bacterium]
MEDLIKKYIDEKNTNLYNELKEKYPITLTKYDLRDDGKNYLWQMSFQQNEYRIGYYEDINSTGFFTHELLHIHLIDKGFSNFPDILPDIKEGKKNLIFLPIIHHVNNILAHQKFYDDFIKMGYTPQEFISDFNDALNPNQIITNVDDAFLDGSIPYIGLTTFIGYYFTARDNRNPNKEDDFQVILNHLANKDKELFQILDNFWNSWRYTKSLENKLFLKSLFEQTEKLLDERKK